MANPSVTDKPQIQEDGWEPLACELPREGESIRELVVRIDTESAWRTNLAEA